MAEAVKETSEQTVTYKCPNCGGIIKYDINAKNFLCESCKSEYTVEIDEEVCEHDFDTYDLEEAKSEMLTDMHLAICDSCGGEIYFDSHETAKRCPMCSSPKIREQAAESGIAPHGIIPFRIDKYEAQQRFHQWITKRFFAPNLLKKAYQEGILEGLYVPFWTYDSDVSSFYSGFGGKTRTYKDSKGNIQTRTDWYPVSGHVSQSFDDILVCASKRQSSKLLNAVSNYDTITDIESFAPEYLSGYMAERYSIDGKEGFETAKEVIDSTMRSLADSHIRARGYDRANVVSIRSSYDNITYKSVLLPLYSAQYSYKGKDYSYAINGQTGKIKGNYPLSPVKISILIAAITAVIILLVFFINGGF